MYDYNYDKLLALSSRNEQYIGIHVRVAHDMGHSIWSTTPSHDKVEMQPATISQYHLHEMNAYSTQSETKHADRGSLSSGISHTVQHSPLTGDGLVPSPMSLPTLVQKGKLGLVTLGGQNR